MAELFPVSPERHGKRFWRRFPSYEFVHEHQKVPIVLGEHEQTAATLPIVFMRTASGLSPVALTRLGKKTALVAPNGAWRGAYVPSILRVHPFHTKPTNDGKFVLLVNEASGLITDDPADEPFFDTQGGLSATVEDVLNFFKKRVTAELRTEQAMSEIVERDLLKPLRTHESFAGLGESVMVPNTEKIAALMRNELYALHRVSALSLLYASCIAQNHISFLAYAESAEARLEGSRSPSPQINTESGATGTADLSEFFEALAVSQDSNASLPDFADDVGSEHSKEQGGK